ncbi:SRPBCC family protein [Nocardia sp. ET3-3]|uniref:SRPBCC family protein n=1 Tax=Nocardia terrae TaxID=2675851 RepID=A0A7K1URU8_9NOCA|nr:SRPBCC family protein [Nocardia terrae]MVU77072.1 SRPBCC family protein [Nocardia terrae]
MLSRLTRRPAELVHTATETGVRDELSLFVAAPPEALWDLVSDVTQMSRWSPENRGAQWLSPISEPVPGAWFLGFNRIGPVPWVTPCEVTIVDPPRHFEFRVHLIGTSWGYLLEPAEGGTVVTEYREWPYAAPLLKLLRLSGPIGRPRDNLALDGLYRSMYRLKALAEAAQPGPVYRDH